MKDVVYLDMDGVLVDFPSAKPRVRAVLWEENEASGCLHDLPGIFVLMDGAPGRTSSSGCGDTWGDVAHKRLILSHHKDLSRAAVLVGDSGVRQAGRRIVNVSRNQC